MQPKTLHSATDTSAFQDLFPSQNLMYPLVLKNGVTISDTTITDLQTVQRKGIDLIVGLTWTKDITAM
jgi:hypothetical protein